MLFILLVFYFFNQLGKLPGKVDPFKVQNTWAFLICIALVPVNWYLEWLKWIISIIDMPDSLDRSDQFQAFAAGMVTGFFTPSMLGNFIGRLPFFVNVQKVNVVYLTQYGNFAQFAVTAVFGAIAFCLIDLSQVSDVSRFVGQFTALLIGSSSLLLFFGFDPVMRRVKWLKKNLFEKVNVKLSLSFRFQLFLLSCLRHAIFTIQFFLLLIAFGVNIETSTVYYIWSMYLIVTLIPSLFFGKILIRDSVAWLIFGSVGLTVHQVFSTTLWIWVLNLLLPAVFFLTMVNVRQKWAE